MKKIVVITPTNPLDKYGHSGVVFSITNELRKKYEIIWLKPKVSLIGILMNLIPILYVYFLKAIGFTISHHPAISKMYAHNLNKELKKINYDYILGFESMYLCYLKTSKPIFYRSDAVIHSMFDYYIFNVPKWIQKYSDKIEYETLRKCTYMFVPSQWVIDEIKKWYSDIDLHKIKFIHSGANMPFIASKPEKKCNINSIKLLFIGSDPIRKGIDIAYDTVKILNEEYKIKSELTIIGGDIGNYKTQPFVNYLGLINKNKPEQAKLFEDTIKSSNWFIFPTKAECAGIVTCEISAYGLPSIGYNTGGVSSYIQDEINGYCLPIYATAKDYAEKIANTSLETYLFFSSNARKLYEDYYNWPIWGQKVIDLIEKSHD